MNYNNEWLIGKTVIGLIQLEKEYHELVNKDDVEKAEEKLELMDKLEQRIFRLNKIK